MNDVFFFSKILSLLLLAICLILIFSGLRFILKTIPFSKVRQWHVKKIMTISGCIFLYLGHFEFISGSENTVNIRKQEKDIFFILDYTSSMRVVDQEGRSRIKYALDEISNIVENTKAGRFGLSIFSESDYRLIPLTNDKEFFKQSITSLQQTNQPEGGGDLNISMHEVLLREKNNNNLVAIIISDFEGVNVQQNTLDIFQKKFTTIALGVGTSGGGKIPKIIKNKYQRPRYLKKSGKNVISYFDAKSFRKFKNRLKLPSETTKYINPFLKVQTLDGDNGWYSEGTRPHGNHLVFIGILLLFLSRLLMILDRHFFLNILFPFLIFSTSVGAVDQSSVEEKLIRGEGTKEDFLIYAKFLIVEKKYGLAREVYKEHKDSLSDLEKVNLGTLHFLNEDIDNGIQFYFKYLESIKQSGVEYDQVRENLITLFKQDSAGGGAGNDSKQPSDEGGDKSRGGDGNERRENKGSKGGLSDNDVLDKVKSDDMVNQGEYIKKKLKANKNKGEIKW